METFRENRKILYVDDEPELLHAFTALMRKENNKVKTLLYSNKIEEMLDTEGPFAVVLSDQRMPGLDGVDVLDAVKQKFPETIRVLVTGYTDYKDTIRAINIGGINSYISKPWNDEDVKRQVNEWITQFNLKQHNSFLMRLLDQENKDLSELLEGTVAQSVSILGDIANHVSPHVASMSERVRTLGKSLLPAFPNLTATEKWEISRALDLFNFGIALLPPETQNLVEKHGLSILDRSAISRNHHLLAAGLLKDIPRFQNVARIIELQARDYNGSGEPLEDHTKGNDIPFGARLLHILIDLAKPHHGEVHGTDLFHQMEHMPQKYDGNIIRQILGKHTETTSSTVEKSLMVFELQPGMVLIDDVRAVSGQLLIKPNFVLTETFLNILLQWHKKDPIKEPIRVRCMSES